MVIGEEVTLTIRVAGAYERFVDPPLADFEIVGRYSKKRVSNDEFRPVRYLEIGFRLRPRRLGDVAIGPARLIAGGQTVASSTPRVVRVGNPPPPATPERARDLSRFAGQPAFLHATTAANGYVVGQPFVLTWDLYYRPDVVVTPVNVHTKPSLGGLRGRETQLKPGEPEEVTIDGRPFRKVAYSRQVVIAAAPIEELVVDPLTLNVNFEARFSKAKLRSNTYKLRISSLPRVGRPDWFRAGNVGAFELTATWQYLRGDQDAKPTTAIPQRLVADDFLILDLAVKGAGNLEGVTRPHLDGTQRFEVVGVRARHRDVVTIDPNGVRGARHWRLRLRPRELGTYTLPKVRFAFFEPTVGKYELVTEKARMVTVDQTMRPVMGGLTLQNRDLNAARAEVGWPNVKITYTIPVEDDVDASPQVALFYGQNMRAGTIGLELGAEIRWQFWRDGPLSAALVPNPSLLVVVPTRGGHGAIGLRFGVPAVAFGYQATSTISLLFGAQVPFWMTLGPDPEVWLPVMADLGVEFQVHRTDDAIVNLVAAASAGPSFCLNRCPGPAVEFGLRAFVGGAIVW